MALLLTLPAISQESDNKKINKIKRDSQYLYDEATMPDPQEAYEAAMELLNQRIDEYVKTKKKFKSSDNIIIKDIASKFDKFYVPNTAHSEPHVAYYGEILKAYIIED